VPAGSRIAVDLGSRIVVVSEAAFLLISVAILLLISEASLLLICGEGTVRLVRRRLADSTLREAAHGRIVFYFDSTDFYFYSTARAYSKSKKCNASQHPLSVP
jgi:hypothetical protein